jgi:hypothetical protein
MLNIGNGIFATDSEAEKIIKYFEKWVTDTLSITISIICNYTNHTLLYPCDVYTWFFWMDGSIVICY